MAGRRIVLELLVFSADPRGAHRGAEEVKGVGGEMPFCHLEGHHCPLAPICGTDVPEEAPSGAPPKG